MEQNYNINFYKIRATTIAMKNPNIKYLCKVNVSVINITLDGVSKAPMQAAKSTNISMSISSNSAAFSIK